MHISSKVRVQLSFIFLHKRHPLHCPKGCRTGGVNNRSVFCKHHNGTVLCTDSTSTRALFFVAYLRAESGALDSNKLDEKEALHTVPDVALHNSCSTPRGTKNVLKPQRARLYKQSGHIPHAYCTITIRCNHSIHSRQVDFMDELLGHIVCFQILNTA